jgi:hypothetical protein
MGVQRTCKWRGCGKPFTAKAADVARGWGLFCSKSCKGIEQESRTGQNARYRNRRARRERQGSYGSGAVVNRNGDFVGYVGPFESDGNAPETASDLFSLFCE